MTATLGYHIRAEGFIKQARAVPKTELFSLWMPALGGRLTSSYLKWLWRYWQKLFPGTMCNNEEFGDYIIYKAWPRYRVFFEGRLDMYGSVLGGEHLKVAHASRMARSTQKAASGLGILQTGSMLSSALNTNPAWQLIYSDPVASIFVRDKPEYQHLIDK